MNFVYTLLLAATLVLIQCMIGGTRLIYSFPAYAIAAVAALLSLVSLRRPVSKPSLWCLASALLFAGYVFGRAWVSPNIQLARPDAFLVAACLIVYLFTALHLTETRHRYWVVAALLAMAVVHVGVGAMQFRDGEGFMLFGFHRGETYEHRASGQLICPNHLAGYLETLALFALSLTLWGRNRAVALLLTGYMTLLCFAGLAITGSRGGYLSMTAGLLAFTVLSLWVVRIYNASRFTLTALISIALLALFLGSSLGLMAKSKVIRERLQKIGTASEDVRWYNWLATIDQFKRSPWLGTGAGTHLYYGRLFRRPQIQADPQHAHGDYLELLGEYGMAGGALALFFLLTHISCGVRTVREITLRRICNSFGSARSDSVALTLGALGAVAALLAHSVIDFNMHIPGNALLFAFIFGMLANPGLELEARKAALLPLTFVRLALGVLGGALLAAVVKLHPSEQLTNQARLAMGGENYGECVRLAKLALAKDPANADAAFYQGEAFRATAANMISYGPREHSFKQAIEAYRQGLAYFPENENLWVRLGQCLDSIYQFDDAEEAYRNAIKTDPNLGVLYSYYAAHLRMTGDEEGAKARENTAQALGSKGVHEEGMGDPPSLLEKAPKENERSP